MYILGMANEKEELDLDAIINNMSSINSEDYWFTKVSNVEEHDASATPNAGSAPSSAPDQNK